MKRVALILAAMLILLGCRESEREELVYELELHNYSGKNVRDYLEDSGAELIVLNYWATFCAPCKKEMVDLSRLQSSFKDKGVLVVGASIDNASKLSLIKSIAGELGVNYPILYGLDAQFDGQSIIGLPVTFFINREGVVLERVDNKRDYSFFEERVESFLALESGFGNAGEESALESSYYSLSYSLEKRSDSKYRLELSLRPQGEYYFNGEGYPPLKLELQELDGIKFTPRLLEAAGVEKEGLLTWQVEVEKSSESDSFSVEGHLSLIACTEESCNMVNEAIQLRLNF